MKPSLRLLFLAALLTLSLCAEEDIYNGPSE